MQREIAMARKRVTMQDIANACGLSRNTVSKIFNGRGAVPEVTRQLVLRKAQELGIRHFATTLASSRWKSLEQINRAGLAAEQAVGNVEFWAQNWRKGGLQERRNQLLKEYGFYNQLYCGCEFSCR
jgi:transcriptional regulator with XRE-family HTH domain